MDVENYLALAERHRARRAWRAAAEALDAVLALDPRHVDAYNELGMVSEEQKKYARAEECYRKALALDPACAPARYNLAMLYRSRKLIPQAIAELELLLPAADPEQIADLQDLLAELRAAVERRCAACGCTSPLSDQFSEVKGRGSLCPRCHGQLQERRQRRSQSWLALFLALVVVLDVALRLLGVPEFVLANAVLFYLALYLLVIPHELAHALVGWLTGSRVFEIRFGTGPRLIERRLGSLVLALHRYPSAGLCVIAPTRRDALRRQVLLTVAAGPIFNLLLALALLPGCNLARLSDAFAWRETLVLANGMLLLSSVIGKVYVDGATALPDLMQILLVLSGQWEARAVFGAHFVIGAAYTWQREDFAGTLHYAETGLAAFPRHPYLENFQAAALLELGRVAEARALFEAMEGPGGQEAQAKYIPEPGRRALFHALNLNNLAYAALRQAAGRPGDGAAELACARARAAEAFRLAPWLREVEGTLGAVLIETGDPAEGVAHVETAAQEDKSDRQRAVHRATLAIGHARLGQSAEAARLLAEAERLDPNCWRLPDARAAVLS